MKTLYRYLFRELTLVTVSAVGVLTGVLVLLNVFRDLFNRLQNTDVSLWVIIQLVLLLIPFVLSWTLPWGVLLAVLLVFGRMSHDNELLALKASGLGLGPLVAPAIWVSLFFSIVSLAINAYVGPECRKAFLDMSYDTLNKNPMAFLVEGAAIDRFEGYRLMIGSKEGNVAKDVHIWMLDPETKAPVRSIRADRASIQPDLPNQRLMLTLFNARQEERSESAPTEISKIRSGYRAQELPMEIYLGSVFQNLRRKVNVRDQTLREIWEEILRSRNQAPDMNYTPVLTEIQARIALSLSCFTFTLIGIPLAISVHRKETSIGVVLSLVVAIGYYGIYILAQALKKNAYVYPELITWMPNVIGQSLGLYLLWKANKR